jgi:hypothetical protein
MTTGTDSKQGMVSNGNSVLAEQRRRAETFRSLHIRGNPIVLFNGCRMQLGRQFSSQWGTPQSKRSSGSHFLRSTCGRDNRVGMDPESFRFSNLIVLWGANVLSTHPHLWRPILEARKKGTFISSGSSPKRIDP